MTLMRRVFLHDFRLAPALLGAPLLAWSCSSADPEPREPVAAAPAGVPAADSVAPYTGPSLEEVRAAVEEGDLNEALNRMDTYLAAHPDEVDARLLYGRINLDFGEELALSGSGGSAVPTLWLDAEQAFAEAARRRPDDPRAHAGLAKARRLQGDNPGAWQAAAMAIERMDPDGPDPDILTEAGRAGLAVTIEAVRAGEPVPAAARQAERALRSAMQLGDLAAAVPLSDLLAWEGQREEARRVLVEALEAEPESLETIQRLKNLADAPSDTVAALELARTSHPTSPGLLWYLGEARYEQSLVLRRAGDFPKAHEALDRAEECFVLAMDGREEYSESCRDWLHLVRTARGWALREEGRTDDAADAFLAALAAAPDRLEPEADPWTLRLGIYAVLDDYFRAGNLEMGRAVLRRATALHADNADWFNNLAFACRELGVAAQAAGEEAWADELFRESWKAYGRAVELSPDDARLINDRALIAVYYLDEHWDLAESELHRAIRVGETALENLPENVTAGERRAAEEAVGDAWENLAYLDVMRRQRVDRAEGYLENSVRYFPYRARAGVARIRAAMESLGAESPDATVDAGASEEPSSSQEP